MDIASALIVDDSKMARITLKKQLESRDIDVYLAESGEESLDFLRTKQPDMIFMDCMMPGIDGFKATQQITSNPDTSSIPVVMCTGKETDEDKQKAFASGAVGYMKKTSSLEPLNDVLYEIKTLKEHSDSSTDMTAAESITNTEPASPDLSEVTRIAEQSVISATASLQEVLKKLADKGPEYEALAEIARPLIEQIIWEVVPPLAEAIIMETLEKFK